MCSCLLKEAASQCLHTAQIIRNESESRAASWVQAEYGAWLSTLLCFLCGLLKVNRTCHSKELGRELKLSSLYKMLSNSHHLIAGTLSPKARNGSQRYGKVLFWSNDSELSFASGRTLGPSP